MQHKHDVTLTNMITVEPQKDPRVILCFHYVITMFISVGGGEGGGVTGERAADKHRL